MKKPANLSLKTPGEKREHHIKAISEPFELRKKHYQELKELRQQLKLKKEKMIKEAQRRRKQIEENKKRKEINMIKSGKYEVVI